MDYYRWFEAFHVISVIMWMAGMLYLPRLYVYHTTVKLGSESDTLLQIMEKRLLKYIVNPAMLFSLGFGIILMTIREAYYEGWFHVKALASFFMIIIHILLAKHRKNFAMGSNKKAHIYFRILNEAVTVLIIIIIIAVIVKPFR
ncbi:protoporphyrinogen oxidase HemJ [Wolbachia endosymbiont of Dirofilaria (Dirofilaria) immitis]|uniref:protoporphyrinogen oxidase HemJ n=1 Tax=Wolbachia endosymbiont of Dirofilaria (Dirofilaria) immitis TaxID=1812115 RepID=UPI00158C1C5A|nr:protoporphyrinogen oxidase HemJ [Wolbachia endosymbiont of Dirofilaria (Dirofilaria) immitis]QKX02300.1 protoporphyrinogen oxidase HemJ [Wolbachia endosymbiont of Dirofilaria (Dirofilaria) immitis]